MYISYHDMDPLLRWFQDNFKQGIFEALLANWVATTDQPFDTMESPEFCEILQYLYQKKTDLHIPSWHSVHNQIMKMGDTMVAELKQMFTVSYYCFSHADCLSLTCLSEQHTGKVSISLNAWTSKNQIEFLTIVVHYVTNDWRLGKPIFLSHLYYSFALLEETLIDFKELISEHSGDNMADAIWGTLKLYGINDKVHFL